jgi:aconitate decarboxylase
MNTVLIWHWATVIFPAALAVSQDIGVSGEDFITACVVGYEVGCRVGEYLGKSHYEVCYLNYMY